MYGVELKSPEMAVFTNPICRQYGTTMDKRCGVCGPTKWYAVPFRTEDASYARPEDTSATIANRGPVLRKCSELALKTYRIDKDPTPKA